MYSDSHGRCGVRFLTTYDRRFVIKAVSSEDVAEMHNILKKYHQVWGLGRGKGVPSLVDVARKGCFA